MGIMYNLRKKMKNCLFLRLFVCVLVLLNASCANKSKKVSLDKASPAASQEKIQQDEILEKDISYDPKGSDGGDLPIQSIHFGFDQSTLSPNAREILARNVDWIKENTQVNIQIEGHCDQRGSVEYNLALGERRARAAKNYLIDLGIKSSRLEIISYGEEKLLDDGESKGAHKKNRRVNFVLFSTTE